ncbi:SpoIID/LytB domain-containing protein [Solirubrobacter sp. CPCC 204708]|uniref:SpoIID/LytB domain-containing protein n=1 Tax=Solirubrobacter deserti TaxID=2282478 RepID=A0ABT4RBS6_9ACTN|nr:SpoIID/LytB domain-containing protein [Solirubrobacter deserti]MBE2317118.1 SpoIID/LytB domain-containing protein [Solirubrobacter deserti]MDA0135990.1 SpoIID/LytB domain-containing protein [Solirubrobacter deserti]
MPRFLLATLAASLVLSAPAAAQTTFTIKGAGFGHGVGMSQYGALGYAQNGWDAARILGHYYTGTSLGTTDPTQKVRVLLVPSTSSARISGARQAGSRRLDPTKTYVVRRRGLSQVELLSGGRRFATFTAPLQIAGEGGVTTLGGHGSYRGVMEFKPGNFSGMTVTNVVALDDYLQGVVPAESPASWPAEALRAQAIAARTYAITTAKSEDFDHYADTRSQVYKGVGIEQPSTNAAVADTRGQIVTYQGQPVVTYFFSTSGGRTESVENTSLGNEPKPWLKSVEDEFDNVSPRHRWTTRPSMASAKKKLGGLVKGSFKGIRVTKRGESPRIVSAEVVGSRGVSVTDGATLRARLGLFDSWAYFTSISGSEDEPTEDEAGGTAAPPGFGAFIRPIGVLRGSVISESRNVKVQALRDGRWVTVGSTKVRRGKYRWAAVTPGTYRAVVDGANGPAVNIR